MKLRSFLFVSICSLCALAPIPFFERVDFYSSDIPSRSIVLPQQQNKAKSIIGQRFKDFKSTTPNGETHYLSEYAGKGNWVLLNFWGSWCPYCEPDNINVLNAYKDYHSKGLVVIGYACDKSKADWTKAISEWGMPWINLSDLQGWECDAVEAYNVQAIPQSFLIDPKGIVIARGLTREQVETTVAKYLR